MIQWPGFFDLEIPQSHALCTIGFQGLMHDEVTGNIYQRAREYSTRLGRFNQRDPLGYPDGMNTYAAYHVMWGGVDPYGLNYSEDNFNKIIDASRDNGVHFRLARELKKIDDTGWDVSGGGGYYQTGQNDIGLPSRYYIDPDVIMHPELVKTLSGGSLGLIYNEMWHAFWDQRLEEDDDCKWIYNLFIKYAKEEYDYKNGNSEGLVMVEELASETIMMLVNGAAARDMLRKRGAKKIPAGFEENYKNNAQPPLHNGPGEKWNDPKYAKYVNKMPSQKLYDLVVYVYYNGCDLPNRVLASSSSHGREDECEPENGSQPTYTSYGG